MGKQALIAALLLAETASFAAQSTFDATTNRWTLSNDVIQVSLHLNSAGNFLTESIINLVTGDTWNSVTAAPSSLIHLQAGSEVFDASRQYILLDQYTDTLKPAGVRQYIVLQDVNGVAQITVALDLYDTQPVLRHSVNY